MSPYDFGKRESTFSDDHMLYDERHPQLGLVFLMVHEAMERRASLIVLTRGESSYTVSYDIGGELVPHDAINNRHWHQTLGALHMLLGETAFFDPDHPDDPWAMPPTGDSRVDRILINDRFPAIDNTQLNCLRKKIPLPIILAVTFEMDVVMITINP